MKYFLVLVFVTYIALAEEIISQQRAKKFYQDCIQESSVDSKVLRNANFRGEIADDEKLNNFFLCYFKRLGFINEAGEYDIEKFTAMGNLKFVEDCKKTSLGDGISNGIKLFKCFSERSKLID